MQRQKVKWLALAVLIPLLITGCASTRPEESAESVEVKPQVEQTQGVHSFEQTHNKEQGYTISKGQGFYLDTIIDISVFEDIAPSVMDQAFTVISDSEKAFSRHLEGSEISKLNAKAGQGPQEVSKATMGLLEKGYAYALDSQGKFDLTIGPLIDQWQIGTEDAHIPEKTDLEEAISLVDYQSLVLDKEAMTAELKGNDMILDLGGIAKGYIADEVKTTLKDQGVTSGIINLGGNVLTIGKKPTGDLWKIGVQNPDQSRGDIIGILEIEDQSVVSSGVYERFFMGEDGTRYHHILDPETGYPVENGIEQVTIVSDLSVEGDANSTTVFLMGMEEGMAYLKSREDIEGILVTDDKKVYVETSLKSIFTLVDNTYEVHYF